MQKETQVEFRPGLILLLLVKLIHKIKSFLLVAFDSSLKGSQVKLDNIDQDLNEWISYSKTLVQSGQVLTFEMEWEKE